MTTEIPHVSVVIATYNRRCSLIRLLEQLSVQTLGRSKYEAVVVDDGSAERVEPFIRPSRFPFAVRVITQANAGAAAARHRGIIDARAALIVVIDDDMQVPPEFLARHLVAHPAGSRRVVLGRIRADPAVRQMPLFERWYAHRLDTIAGQLASGRLLLNGSALYSGNMSLRRADYLAVGGFDQTLARSEDAELGLRLEASGVELAFAPDAFTLHGSDHTSEAQWLRRAFSYGVFDSKIRAKHPTLVNADPWRFLFKIRASVRPLLAAAAVAPNATRPLSRLLLALMHGSDRLGLARTAYAGSAVAYSMEYFRGVRQEAGSLDDTVSAFMHHLDLRRHQRHGDLRA